MCMCVCVWGRGGGRQSGVGEYLAYRLLLTAVSRWQDWFVGMDIHTLLIYSLQYGLWLNYFLQYIIMYIQEMHRLIIAPSCACVCSEWQDHTSHHCYSPTCHCTIIVQSQWILHNSTTVYGMKITLESSSMHWVVTSVGTIMAQDQQNNLSECQLRIS